MQGDSVRRLCEAMYKALNIGREKTGEDIKHRVWDLAMFAIDTRRKKKPEDQRF